MNTDFTEAQIWKLVGLAVCAGFLIGAGVMGAIYNLMGVGYGN